MERGDGAPDRRRIGSRHALRCALALRRRRPSSRSVIGRRPDPSRSSITCGERDSPTRSNVGLTRASSDPSPPPPSANGRRAWITRIGDACIGRPSLDGCPSLSGCPSLDGCPLLDGSMLELDPADPASILHQRERRLRTRPIAGARADRVVVQHLVVPLPFDFSKGRSMGSAPRLRPCPLRSEERLEPGRRASEVHAPRGTAALSHLASRRASRRGLSITWNERGSAPARRRRGDTSRAGARAFSPSSPPLRLTPKEEKLDAVPRSTGRLRAPPRCEHRTKSRRRARSSR